jgi:hypothetical protein
MVPGVDTSVDAARTSARATSDTESCGPPGIILPALMTHIYDVLGPVIGLGSVLALSAVLVLLLRGAYRRFWVVLVYVSWELLATVAFTIADVLYGGTAQVSMANRTYAQMWYARLYWLNDVLVDLFRFVLVIVLIYKVTPEGNKRWLWDAC